MENVIDVIPLFPTPAIITNINREFTKDELQFLLSDIQWYIKTSEDEKDGMTNHRSEDLFLFDNFAEELKDIKNFCEYSLTQFLEQIEGVDTDRATLRITQSWLNKTKPQERHHSHFHANSYLSGVLYINCLPNDSIMFGNRLHDIFKNITFPIKKSTLFNVPGQKQEVKTGDLIIFPSYMIHRVNVNKTKNEERISLSFNTFPIGEMGEYRGSYLKL